MEETVLLISIFMVVALLAALIALPIAAQGTRRSARILWVVIGVICVVGLALAYRLAISPNPYFFG